MQIAQLSSHTFGRQRSVLKGCKGRCRELIAMHSRQVLHRETPAAVVEHVHIRTRELMDGV